MRIHCWIVVATVIMSAVARGIWVGLDGLLGRSLLAQIVAVGASISVAVLLYARIALAMRIPEARQIEQLIRQRLGRAQPA